MRISDLLREKKKRERKQQQKDTVRKLALGTIIGAVAGILLAPKSGKETREDISNKTREAAETAKKSIKDSADTIKNVQEKVMEDIQDKVKEIKDRDMFEVELENKEVDIDEIELKTDEEE